MEVNIENEDKCDLFIKLFPLLFDPELGNFVSYVLKINNEGLSINQRDINGTTQFDVKYSKNAFDFISNEESCIKFNGNHIRKILDVAKKTRSEHGSITLKYFGSNNPYLQVITTQKYSIRLESLTDEDEVNSIEPYIVDKYATISNLEQCSKLISTLSTIVDNNTSAVELVLSEKTLTFHAMDEEGVKEAEHKISCASNTKSVQKVKGSFHHLEYISRLIDAGAKSLKFYVQTDNNLIFEISFPYDIKITIYAARFIS